MNGRFSRAKGKRNEYSLRDEIRRYGFVADRVPTSGAAQGFKGDIKFSKDGKTYLAELKARKDAFRRIYAIFDAHKKSMQDDKMCFSLDGKLVTLTSSLIGALEDCGIYPLAHNLPQYEVFKRTFAKISNMFKLVKGCDVLVIKDDRMPFLYLRYR